MPQKSCCIKPMQLDGGTLTESLTISTIDSLLTMSAKALQAAWSANLSSSERHQGHNKTRKSVHWEIDFA